MDYSDVSLNMDTPSLLPCSPPSPSISPSVSMTATYCDSTTLTTPDNVRHIALTDVPLPLALSGLTNDLDLSLIKRDAFAVGLTRSPCGSPWGIFSRPGLTTNRSSPPANPHAMALAMGLMTAPAPTKLGSGYQSLGQVLGIPNPAGPQDIDSQYSTAGGVGQDRRNLPDALVKDARQPNQTSQPNQTRAEPMTDSRDSDMDPDAAAPPAPPPPQVDQHQPPSTQFNYPTSFDMLDMAVPHSSNKSRRPLPNPGPRDGQIPTATTNPSTLHSSQPQALSSALGATDYLSGSPAPGAASHAPTSPPGGGQVPLVPSKAPEGTIQKSQGSGGGTSARGQSVSQGTPDSHDEGEDYKGRYMANEFVSAWRSENGSGAKKSCGVILRPPSEAGQPQRLMISTHTPNTESLFIAEEGALPPAQAITIFPSPSQFFPGHKVAVDGHITYATKMGRIRVIDQSSGARMMLKKHEARIADMAMGQPTRGATGSSSRKWRCLASVGFDGRLVIWKLPVRFAEDTATHEVFAEIMAADDMHSGSPMRENRFTAVKWHPRDGSTLLVATNDGRVVLLKLDKGSFVNAWKRAQPVGRPMSEADAFTAQDVITTRGKVWAIAFSPDGSTFAYVTDNNELMIRQTSKPGWAIMSAQLPSEEPVTSLDFFCDARGRPAGVIVARAEGRKVEIWELARMSKPSAIVELVVPPDGDGDGETMPLFGHVAWHQAYNTLLLSNSTRGSLMAFHVDVPQAIYNSKSESTGPTDDANYIEQITARRQPATLGMISPVLSAAFIDHVSEIPLTHSVVSFVLDATQRKPPLPTLSTCSVYYVTPRGMQQISLPMAVMEPTITPSIVETRRKSLAGEILVDVHVEQTTEPIEPVTFSPTEGKAATTTKENGITTSSTPVANAPSVNEPDAGYDAERSTASMSKENNTASAASKPKGPRTQVNELDSALVKELKKLEDRLDARQNKFYVKELQRQEARLEEDRLMHQTAESARQETMLKLISNTLTKNTSKTLESTIKTEVKTTILPAVTKLVEQAVDDHVKQGVQDALKKSLPFELEKLLLRPDISTHITRSFSTSVGPMIEHHFVSSMHGTLLPAFKASAAEVLETLVQETRAEITSVRKEIVTEQSQALMGAEQEIRDLRGTVDALRAQMQNMQEVMRQLIGSPSQSFNTTSTTMAPPLASYPNHDRGVSTQHPYSGIVGHHQVQAPTRDPIPYDSPRRAQQMYHQPPPDQYTSPRQYPIQKVSQGSGTSKDGTPTDKVKMQPPPLQPPQGVYGMQVPIPPPQARTPTHEYEDMFLRALSNDDPAALANLVDAAPPHRLEAVFSRGGQWGKPALSQAVVLTLAHKLSEAVSAGGNGSQSLSAEGMNRLRWIWSCVSAVDYKDAQTAQYSGRVLDLCSNALEARQSQLNSYGSFDDAKGIAEVLRLIREKTELQS